MSAYIGNYRRLVYLSQTESAKLDEQARAHAQYLGLDYEHIHTGLAPVDNNMKEHAVQWRN
jgi:hypothetical protein